MIELNPKRKYLGITIDYERDKLLPEQGIAYMTGDGFYKKEHETSPQETFARAATSYCFGDYEFAQRLYDYVSRGWFMFASPVLSNAIELAWPKFGPHEFEKAAAWVKKHAKPDGLPISCFLSMIPDSKEGLVETRKEAAWLSMQGGGVGIYAGNRSPDRKSTGVMSHLKGYDADTIAYRQTAQRRGSMAVYMDIDHPEIVPFISMRQPAGGNPNQKNFNLNNGVNVTDAFMESMIKGLKYELVDPKHGKTNKFVEAREIWDEMMTVRFETGEPYMLFIDTVNRGRPKWITKPTYQVRQSNLCVVGETMINVTLRPSADPIEMRIDDFVDMFNTGTIPDAAVKTLANSNVIWSKVTAAAQTGTAAELFDITSPRSKNNVRCTGEHLVFTKNRGFIEARKLSESDDLAEIGYPDSKGCKINIFTTTNDVPVFDITVPETKSFFANDILVHNCSEITLMTSAKRTAVCCLSSTNMEMSDEWEKDPMFIKDLIRLLDNVLEFFIQLAPPELWKAVRSAQKERAVGLGSFGFASWLQKNMIPFESGFLGANGEADRIVKYMKEQAIEGSKILAQERGEPADVRGSGMRNSHLMAFAPNASSAAIFGASPAQEPWNGNAFTAQGRAGSFLIKNKYLEALLETKGKNTDEVWSQIVIAEGSVFGLEFLSDFEKSVFITAYEVNGRWIIEHAATRQQYVCQAQSTNIFMHAHTTKQEMSDLHILAWAKGLKSLYYCRAKAPSKAQVGTGGSQPLNAIQVRTKVEFEECLSCQG